MDFSMSDTCLQLALGRHELAFPHACTETVNMVQARVESGKGTIFDKFNLSNTSYMELEP